MYSNANIIVNGRTYFVEKINGEVRINGMSQDTWLNTLDPQALDDLDKLGREILSNKIKGNFQTVVNDYHKMRNN